MESNFIKPHYNIDGFAGIPRRITTLINANRYDAVILFVIDSFGWRFFEKFQDRPFFRKISSLGTIAKLTSQFPSTTAAHLTTIHTGMPVGEHGIYEWYYYEPTLDVVIAPLLYSFAGTPQRETLKSTGANPFKLFPISNFYSSIKELGSTATIFQHRDLTPTTYSDFIFRGAKTIGYRTLSEGFVNLSIALSNSKTPAYYYFYFDRIDAIGHEYGPESTQMTAEIMVFLMTMEHIFLKALTGNHKKILFLMTADHGQVETDPRTTIYINRDAAFTGMEKFLRTNRSGELIVPAGSARDFFLYIKPGMLDEAQAFLASRLDGRAEVRKVTEMMADGFFGPIISSQFRGRAGDLVILPYRGESVWWYEKDRFEQKFYGHHGGLTKEEMEIPLITWEM